MVGTAIPCSARNNAPSPISFYLEERSANLETPPEGEKGVQVFIHSNLLVDLYAIPNLGVELLVAPRWSLLLDGYGAWWSKANDNFFWRLRGGEVGIRYWLTTKAMWGRGQHIGLYAQLLDYDFQMQGTGYLGDQPHWGIGLAYGYSFALAERWSLDLELGVGYLTGIQKRYGQLCDGCFPWQATKRIEFWGPTKLGITLSYRL